MGRLKYDEIENKENEDIARLMRKYIGDDSYKDIAIRVGVDPSTISLISRGKVKPTIEVIYRFGQFPHNNVYFEDWMAVRFPLAVMRKTCRRCVHAFENGNQCPIWCKYDEYVAETCKNYT